MYISAYLGAFSCIFACIFYNFVFVHKTFGPIYDNWRNENRAKESQTNDLQTNTVRVKIVRNGLFFIFIFPEKFN